MEKQEKYRNIAIITIIILIVGIIFFYQTQKIGFHEDEVYTIGSSVNKYDGLMSPYREKDVHTMMFEKYIFDDNFFTEMKNAVNYLKNQDSYAGERDAITQSERPIWKTKEDVKKYITLTSDNYLNLKSIYYNQLKDSHPPFFYTLVHFSTLLFGGQFSKYSVFIVNIIAFIISCFVIKKILKTLDKENLTIATLIFYGLSMGTISMVIYQRMYMLLTMFILLYFYYSIKLYKNDFNLTLKMSLKLGIITILGFLTQYYFAIFAFLILIIMILKMLKDKKYKNILKYIGVHLIYAVIGIMLFVPCIYHLFSSSNGISNLDNTEYFKWLMEYIQDLVYAFTIQSNNVLDIGILAIFVIGLIYSIKKSNQKFIMILTFLPSVIYFFLVIKLTSIRELRYIMPIMPFVALTLIFIFDNVLKIKYKDITIIAIAIILIIPGFIFSKPRYLFEEYKECLEIANENSDKSFVYIYDNIFNHIQSVPEMMIYEKTMIINYNRNELQYCINDEELNSEDEYILCIKTYMNNDEIIEQILDNTEFKNVTKLYEGGNSHDIISNNLYLVSK